MSLEKITLKKGEVIFLQGTFDDKMYKLVEGKVGIFNAKEIDDASKIGEVEAGAFFGERALIKTLPRAVSAIALEDGTTFEVIKEADFDSVIADPANAKAIIEKLSMNVHDLALDYIEACKKIVELDEAGAIKNPDSAMKKFIGKCKEIVEAVDRIQADRMNLV